MNRKSSDDADGETFDLFSTYELEGSQQLAGARAPSADREPGESRRGVKGWLAHAAAHELICSLNNYKTTQMFKDHSRVQHLVA